MVGTSLMTFQSRDDYSYLLGPDVFVTPLLADVTTVEVRFPEGRWQYVFDRSRVFEGGTHATVDVPLSEFPVFVRAGSEAAATLP